MRLLSTILAAVSFLLLMGVAVFWARSYWYYEGLVHFSPGGDVMANVTLRGQTVEERTLGGMRGLISLRGRVAYATIAVPTADEPAWQTWSHPRGQPLRPGAMLLMRDTVGSGGLGWGRGHTTAADNQLEWRLPFRHVTVSYFVLAILTAILPARWFVQYRQSVRWEKQGRFAWCGHDLGGRGGACPQCRRRNEPVGPTQTTS